MSKVPNIIDSEYILRQKEDDWSDIPPKDKALAFAYVQSGYKVGESAKELKISPSKASYILRQPLVAAYISHIANARESCHIVTKHFITTQYMRLLPMVFGDENIPIVLADGTQIDAKKFSANDVKNVLQELSKMVDVNGFGDKPTRTFEVQITTSDETD